MNDFSELIGSTEKFASSPDFSRIQLGDGKELIYCPASRESHVMTGADGTVLLFCCSFASIADHAEKVAKTLNVTTDMVLERLNAVISAGAMISERELQRLCMSSSDASRPATRRKSVTSLGIPTRNRPDMLLRCLRSYGKAAVEHGSAMRLLIADTSDQPMLEQNAQIAEQVKKELGLDVVQLGPAKRVELSRELSRRSGVALETVEFALGLVDGFPINTGSSRNLLLLSSVDELTMQVDDDTICRAAPSFYKSTDLIRFTSNGNPTNFHFCDDREEPPPSPDGEPNFFALHERLLGRRAHELMRDHQDGSLGFDQVNSQLVRQMQNGDPAVAITALGVAGDSGMGGSAFFLRLDGDSRASLLRSEEVYRRGIKQHRVMRSSSELAVSSYAYCMGMNVGLDNSQFMPPFMPVQKNEDGIFSALNFACNTGNFFGFLPWMILHEPGPRERMDWSEQITRMESGDMIQCFLHTIVPKSGASLTSNIRAVSNTLIELGTMPLAEFRDRTTQMMWKQSGFRITHAEELLERYGNRPTYWAKDVKLYVQNLRNAVPKPELTVPRDLEGLFGADEAMVRLQMLLRQLGDLVLAWPALRAAAAEIEQTAALET